MTFCVYPCIQGEEEEGEAAAGVCQDDGADHAIDYITGSQPYAKLPFLHYVFVTFGQVRSQAYVSHAFLHYIIVTI